mgnify:CR=1 FL=1
MGNADIITVIGARAQLRRQGGSRSWVGLCPFHNEQTPSFHVNEASGFFTCFGCGVHGDVEEFKRLIVERHPISEAVP